MAYIIHYVLTVLQATQPYDKIHRTVHQLIKLDIACDIEGINHKLIEGIHQLILQQMPFKDDLPFLKEQSLFDITKSYVHMYQHQYRLNISKEISQALSDIKFALDMKYTTKAQIRGDFPLHLKFVNNIIDLALSNTLQTFSHHPSSIPLQKLTIDSHSPINTDEKQSPNIKPPELNIQANLDNSNSSQLNLTDEIIKQMQTDWNEESTDNDISSPSTKSPPSSDSDRPLTLAQRQPRKRAPDSILSEPRNTLRNFVMESDSDSGNELIPPTSSSCSDSSSDQSNSLLQNTLFDHSLQPISVKGSHDPLSNMYPFKFSFGSKQFSSLEICYQYYQSIHFDDTQNATEIMKAPTSFHARAYNTKFRKLLHDDPNNPKLIEWSENKVSFMKKLLQAKSEQCSLFKQSLINTGLARLYHNTRDAYWGTGTNDLVPFFTGQDKFGYLLMELRSDLLSLASLPTEESEPPTSTSQPISTTSPITLANIHLTPSKRSSSTESGVIPKKTKSTQDNAPNQSQTFRPSLNRQDHIHSFQHFMPNAPWTFAEPLFETVLIFDSNGREAFTIKPYTYTMYCFSGANYSKLYYAARSLEPYTSVKHVFSYVGVNCRDSNLEATTAKSFQKYHSAISKLFPNAKIFHSQIMFDPLSLSISHSQTSNLNALNDHLKFLDKINFMPKPLTLFLNFQPDGIHIRPQYINQLIRSWFKDYIR